MSATMNANSPICARPNPVWIASFSRCPVRIDIVKQFTPLPTITRSASPRMTGRCRRHTAGSTRRPIVTKKTAANMFRSGAASSCRRLRTSVEAPRMPTRNAPSASE